MAFHIGQLVVCVDDAVHPNWAAPGYRFIGGLDGLTRGHVYTIRETGIPKPPGEAGTYGVRLREIVRSSQGTCVADKPFDASRFAPVDHARLTVFREMTRRVERKVGEPA